jgi:OOP family OmpA-OmpF porin
MRPTIARAGLGALTHWCLIRALGAIAFIALVGVGCSAPRHHVSETVPMTPQVGVQNSRMPLAPSPNRSAQPIGQYPDWLFDGPQGRGFASYLAHGYLRYAKQEDNGHDFRSAALFLARARQVERGERVEPEALFQRNIPPHAVSDMLYARHRLMAVFAKNAPLLYPKIAADAQVSFDCWMEQQEENSEPDEVAKCRAEFEGAVVRLESALEPSVAVKAPVGMVPAGRLASRANCEQCSSTNLIYFELDSAELTSDAKKVISELSATILAGPPQGVAISGHTDLAGGIQYNDSLSQKRVDAVVRALVSAGVPSANLVTTYAYGKKRPRVPTPDGERNAGNRRVEVWLMCGQADKPVDMACMQVPQNCSSSVRPACR